MNIDADTLPGIVMQLEEGVHSIEAYRSVYAISNMGLSLIPVLATNYWLPRLPRRST